MADFARLITVSAILVDNCRKVLRTDLGIGVMSGNPGDVMRAQLPQNSMPSKTLVTLGLQGRRMTHKHTLSTFFGEYRIKQSIGEGGAGVVYLASSDDGEVAVKLLRSDLAKGSQRGRFKNEVTFLMTSKHQHLVPVLDTGHADIDHYKGPFYVMPLYEGSLRKRMRLGIPADQVLEWFGAILDGVEAAHLKRVVHRDLKPENILCNSEPLSLVVADFGIASFTDEELLTAVETKDHDRLCNFNYAAPEQKERGAEVSVAADIFALGEILNELFTGQIPQGTNYRRIGEVVPEFGFLDDLVSQMLSRQPNARPASVAVVKSLIRKHHAEAAASQKIGEFSKQVIPEGENDDPLYHNPPEAVVEDYENGRLLVRLSREPSTGWLEGYRRMGTHDRIYGHGPETVEFEGDLAKIPVTRQNAKQVFALFKTWLQLATSSYRQQWNRAQILRRADEQRLLDQQRQHEERRLQVLGEFE